MPPASPRPRQDRCGGSRGQTEQFLDSLFVNKNVGWERIVLNVDENVSQIPFGRDNAVLGTRLPESAVARQGVGKISLDELEGVGKSMVFFHRSRAGHRRATAERGKQDPAFLEREIGGGKNPLSGWVDNVSERVFSKAREGNFRTNICT